MFCSRWKRSQRRGGSSGVCGAARSQSLPPGELAVAGGDTTKTAVSTACRASASRASHASAQWSPVVPPAAPGDGAPLATDDLDGMQALVDRSALRFAGC